MIAKSWNRSFAVSRPSAPAVDHADGARPNCTQTRATTTTICVDGFAGVESATASPVEYALEQYVILDADQGVALQVLTLANGWDALMALRT
jgi:hypothetical protein